VPGFVMEEYNNDTVTILVYSIPAITVGVLHVLKRNRVIFLYANHFKIINCITELCADSNKFISKNKSEDPT